MLALEGVFMIPPLIIAAVLRERASIIAFAEVIAFCFLLGAGGIILKADFSKVYAKEGYVTVALAWIVLSAVGALPYTLSGSIPNYIDALFECISGFTTTGATTLTDIEALPRSMQYWRCFTNWLGGMGVLIFIIAVMPRSAGSGTGLHIMKAESPGPSVGKLVPKMRSNARILYGIYVDDRHDRFDNIQDAGLALSVFWHRRNRRVSVSDSCAHTAEQQVIITVFMILFGISFSLYFR